jgi:hypothetical protein
VIRSIEINLGVGHGAEDRPSDSTSTTFPVDCDDASDGVDLPPSASDGDGEDTSTDDTTDPDVSNVDGVDVTDPQAAGVGDTGESAASKAASDTDAAETNSASAGSGDESEDTRQLPATDASPMVQGTTDMVLVTLLSSVAVVPGFTALHVRRQAGRPRE